MRRALVFLLAVATSGLVWGAGMRMPPGKWWDNPRLVRYLQLSADQQKKIHDAVFEHAERMIDLNAAVKRAELKLADLAQRQSFDERAVRAAFAGLQQARQNLEAERFELLVSVRKVLTTGQWKKMINLREEMRRRRADRRRMRPGFEGQRRRPGAVGQGAQPPAPQGPGYR